MAIGFMAAFPGMKLSCDLIRPACAHAVFGWTPDWHHAETENLIRVSGWEEWALDGERLIANAPGWFDAEEYVRQGANGYQR